MSKNAWQQADDKDSSVDVPANVPSGDVQDDSYATSGPKEPVPVQGDDAPVEDPIDAKTADSDEQLERDDKEAIDPSNIMKGRTRHAKPKSTYKEPSDEQDLVQ